MPTAKRVFWNDDEKTLIGSRMHEVLTQQPELSMLQAVRLAQQVLPDERQRDIIAWSVVQANIEPKLEAARQAATAAGAGAERLGAPPSPGPEASSQALAAPEPEPTPAEAVASAGRAPAPADALPAPAWDPQATAQALPEQRAALAVDPLQLEAAWMVALQSPAVEACLVDVFSRAMAKAFAQMSPESAARSPSAGGPVTALTDARVMLAGFPGTTAKALEDALRELCEVRVWKPGQSQQMFETTARICSLAVIPDGMGDEAEDFLKSLKLKVLRHEGGVGRLLEKVQDALS